MRDMEDRVGREAASYQDTIGRLEADIAKMKVGCPFGFKNPKFPSDFFTVLFLLFNFTLKFGDLKG